MRRKWMLLPLCLLLILSAALPAFAAGYDPSRTGSITITLMDQTGNRPVSGAKFDVTYVAEVGINTDRKLNYLYQGPFKNCGIPLEDPELPSRLSAYREEQDIPALTQVTTDSQGKAHCSALPLGMYLVEQVNEVDGFSTCSPFLVMVPSQNGEDFTYDISAAPKTDVIKLVSVTIRKVWNAGTTPKPASVTVQLLQGETLVQTATLSKDNNWFIRYDNMPESDAYTIKEVNVPTGFTATYTHRGYDFTVTNTAILAQTGQLVWPIPVLAIAGIFFLMMGFLLIRRSGKAHG